MGLLTAVLTLPWDYTLARAANWVLRRSGKEDRRLPSETECDASGWCSNEVRIRGSRPPGLRLRLALSPRPQRVVVVGS